MPVLACLVARMSWEWFRKDGTIMRSGYFENGEQVGQWTTYDKNGKVVKVKAYHCSKAFFKAAAISFIARLAGSYTPPYRTKP